MLALVAEEQESDRRAPRSIRDLAWLAGLLEGEGTFVWGIGPSTKGGGRQLAYPRISLRMTDEDVVRRAYAVAGVGRVNGPYSRNQGHKDFWVWQISRQADAAGLMMTLYPFLGQRRRAKIQELLLTWRSGDGRHAAELLAA